MAVAVSTDFSELVTQYSKDKVDVASARDAFLQLDAAHHAIAFSQMATLAWMAEADSELEHFLQYRSGRTRRESQELVRVSVSLLTLPCLATAFGSGQLSFAQICLLTQLASPETDEQWTKDADGYSVQQLKRLVREKKLLEEPPSEQDASPRSLRFTETETSGKLLGSYPLEMILPLRHILERMADSEGLQPETGCYRPYNERLADALLELAGQRITEDPDPDRATVSIHVDVEQLESGEGIADMDGRPVLVKNIQHYLCDMRFQVVGKNGELTVGIGDISRDIPRWLRRLLNRRDNGCRFPNCQNTKGVDGHHIQWWSLQGPTNLDNLISLCRRHHRLIHQHGWSIEGNPNSFVLFKDNNDRTFSTGPPQLKPRTNQFLNDLLQDDDPTRHGGDVVIDARPLTPPTRGPIVDYTPPPQACGKWGEVWDETG